MQVDRLRSDATKATEAAAKQTASAQALVSALGGGDEGGSGTKPAADEVSMAAIVGRVEMMRQERDRAQRTSKALNNRLTTMLKEQQYNVNLIARLRVAAEADAEGSPPRVTITATSPEDARVADEAAESLQRTVTGLQTECERHHQQTEELRDRHRVECAHKDARMLELERELERVVAALATRTMPVAGSSSVADDARDDQHFTQDDIERLQRERGSFQIEVRGCDDRHTHPFSRSCGDSSAIAPTAEL